MIFSETGLCATFYTLQEGCALLFLRRGCPVPCHQSYDASLTLAATSRPVAAIPWPPTANFAQPQPANSKLWPATGGQQQATVGYSWLQ
jgi:hypothetical protein